MKYFPSHKRGFTLIETIIYLALYALIMTGVLVSVYGIFGSASRNQTKAMVQEEGSYLTGKIDWALTGVQTISAPVANDSGDTLTVTKYDTSVGNPIIISVSAGNVTIKRGAAAARVINNSNTRISCPVGGCFTHVAASGDGINPESLAASFVISATTSEGLAFSQPFATVKYLRR